MPKEGEAFFSGADTEVGRFIIAAPLKSRCLRGGFYNQGTPNGVSAGQWWSWRIASVGIGALSGLPKLFGAVPGPLLVRLASARAITFRPVGAFKRQKG